MQLGAETVFVGSGIFRASNPAKFATAIVQTVRNFKDAANVLDASSGLGDAMDSGSMGELADKDKMADRGW